MKTNEPVAWILDAKMTDCDDNFIWNTGGYPDWQVKDWIPLYTHPAKTLTEENHDWDRGIWTVGETESQEFIESSDFNHDVRLYLNGDFETDTQRLNYLQHIADRLNTHPAKHLSLQKVDGELVAVTYTDDEHRIIEVLWERPPAKTLTDEECEKLMQQWDYWRKQIADGDKSSAPRDWFECVIENLLEQY